MPSALDVLNAMPTVSEIAKQASERNAAVPSEEVEEITLDKVASAIVDYLSEDADARSQVLAGLSERFAPILKEAALRNEEIVSEEELAKIAAECDAAGRFIAQGFISAVEDYQEEDGAE